MKNIESHIESLITRKISSQISAEEEEILANWISDNDENKHYYQDLEKIYVEAETEITSLAKNINIDDEWQRLRQSVQPQIRHTTYQTSWIRIAASIVIIATLGYIVWTNNTEPENITILAETSGQVVILPDNSIVTLNKGAALSYPQKFTNDERLLNLEGEAFFEVSRNPQKAFKVILNQGVVEVLGTSFNINAKNNDQLEVVVVTGKVKLSNSVNENFLILTKGEKGIIMNTNNLVAKANNTDVNFMAWKTRKIVFKDMELDEVIHTLNALYDTNISFSTEVGKNCKVTVSFDNQSIDAILSVLELTHDLEYKKSGDLIEIVKSGC